MVLWTIMKREMVRLASRRIYLFMMVIAPVCCFLFFADLFKEGVPTNLPIAVVDKDNTSTSRSLTRSLDAFGQTEIVMRTGDFSEARKAMQKEKYTVYFIFPKISGRKLLPEKSRYCRFIPTILIFFPVL